MKASLLLVEDDAGLRTSLEKSFRRRPLEVRTASTVAEARQALNTWHADVVLLDLRLPDGSGLEVLTAAREVDESTAVIVMTAFPEVKSAVRAMKGGARDFIVKPFELEAVHLAVDRAFEELGLRRRVRHLEREQDLRAGTREILGECPEINHLREQIERVASTEASVLILGETGTGKELVADSIHRLSERAGGPLIKVNCSAFSEQLLESELFGHVKGAFTDARAPRAGLFEMANGGTLLLDEVSEMKPDLQSKLLRVVEDQSFRRVGGQREIRTDVRVVASTNRDLAEAIEQGSFRQDLYFRLNVFEISVPPLRVRADDIILLADRFLDRSAKALRKQRPELGPGSTEILLAYSWPGNVRELKNVMERAAILCDTGRLRIEHLPVELQVSGFVRREMGRQQNVPSLRTVERRYIQEIVQQVDGNLSEAARVLGISRNTLKSKLAPKPDA